MITDLLNNPAVYPTPEAMAHLFQIGPVPLTAERARTRMWAQVKAASDRPVVVHRASRD